MEWLTREGSVYINKHKICAEVAWVEQKQTYEAKKKKNMVLEGNMWLWRAKKNIRDQMAPYGTMKVHEGQEGLKIHI